MDKLPQLIFFPGHEGLAESFPARGFKTVSFEQRQFPDLESYVRFPGKPEGESYAIVCSLDRPDHKFLMLHFLAKVLKDKGAKQVGLIAPYLGYMRQDKEFHSGEAVTSRYFARLLSQTVDWLVTVDPHLHRYQSLSEIYSIPAEVGRSAPLIAKWIKAQVRKPLLVGPDDESSQWVGAIANDVGAPFVVSQKTRTGDRKVKVEIPNLDDWPDHQPVLMDDIVSSGQTMIETVVTLRKAGKPAPICIAVHPIFADRAYQDLVAAQPKQVVSCNTITHATNQIDIAQALIEAYKCLSVGGGQADGCGRTAL